jgi:hypothetical protein
MDPISVVFCLTSGLAFTICGGWVYRHGEKLHLLTVLGLNKNRSAIRIVKALGLIAASAFTWMFSLVALIVLTRKSFFGHYSQYRLGATILTLALIYFLILKKPEHIEPILNGQNEP